MIKRYGLGAKAEKVTDESVQFGLVGIVERPDGEYYKASDVDAILESIGAGGVNGRITGKTLEQHRKEFEEWVARAYVISGGGVLALQKGGYKHKLIREMWRAWKAARGVTE